MAACSRRRPPPSRNRQLLSRPCNEHGHRRACLRARTMGYLPVRPDICARLICDYIAIEFSVAVSAIASELRRRGAEVTELPTPQPLATVDRDILIAAVPHGQQHPLINDHLQMKAMTITARNLRQPLLETWTLGCWAAALMELPGLQGSRLGESVIPVLLDRTIPWS